ncbi:MAG: Putative transport protein [uncultured Acidimicrobiales bacterium]|uniref:Transport protein n=1 Tax=uncultured Acidimicrobiales bacterium TaxID=310071 RepID=A0A6J4J7Z0_9ACTN|nr:MAG: Putative transport protein [uncultured Acidimicrobiales bacterium]
MSASHGNKAIIAAFFANLGIAIAKFVAFLLTGAASMLAESIHSLADSGNQGLLLLGGRKATRPPSERHPFGYARERYFWAFVVALVLFSMGGLFALYEGVEKLRHPHDLESPSIAIGVLVFAILLEAWSLRTAVVETNKVKRPDESYWRFIKRSKVPELPVVLLEDIGAMVGLVLALVGVVLATVTDAPRFDALGSVGIGILLVVIALVLAVEMKSLLIGEAAEPEVADALKAAITQGPEVTRVLSIRTLQLGPDDVLVAAKVELTVDADSREEVARAIDATEARMRVACPAARLIFLEPDVLNPDAASPV